MLKIYKKDLLIIFACLCLAVVLNLAHYFLAKANPSAQVQFTADTIISLSGISDGDLYVRANSECNSLSVSGAVLTVTGIPDGGNFTLKTSSHNNALSLTPSGGTIDLTLDSSNISSGDITQWTLDGSGSTQVAHIVGTPKANTYYAIKVDGALFNSFKSNDSGEVSFTYDGGFSSKVFTIEEDTTAPTEFDLVSPVNNHSTFDSTPTFSWNACTDPDLDHYELYIDSSLNTDNISDTSITLTAPLSCGSHTWYIKAVDKAGNTTRSDSTFTIKIVCGGGTPSFGTITTNSIEVIKPSTVTEEGYQWQVRRNSATELGFNPISTTSIIDSSLSENTPYTYDVQFKDNVGNISDYGTSATKYTLVDTPTNLRATTVSTNRITLVVDSFPNDTSGSSGYYFENTTTGSNSGWIQTNSWQDTGLSCGTSYTYTVKYRNGDGVETDTISLTQSTKDCGGGVVIGPPVSTIGQGNVCQNLGGEVRKTFDSGRLVKVVFPPYSVKGAVVAKIEPKSKTKVIENNPLPKNTQIIGDLVADFRALSGGKELEKFEGAVSITFTYTDKQIEGAGVDEETLKIYWWDKESKSWKPLKSEVNTLTNKITAYTTHFSLFAVIGETKEKEKSVEEITKEEILIKMIEVLKKLVQVYTELIQILKG